MNQRTTRVVVLGNQKSGASAIAHLIADIAALSKTIDIPETWWPNLGRLMSGEIRIADLCRRYPLRFFKGVVKEPNLSLFYGELAKIYIHAAFLFVIRDPRDNIRSILNRIKVPGNLEQLTLDMFPIDPLWRPILDGNVFSFLNSDHYIDKLSERWNRMADVYLNNRDQIVGVRYEDFSLRKVESITAIARRLNLSIEADISESVDVPYQPRGNRSIPWTDFFGEKNLRRIELACGPRMARFGYALSGV